MRIAIAALISACGHAGFARDNGDANGDGTGDGPPTSSCSGLLPICGPTGTSSCCGSSLVPGGTFFRSYDVGTDNMFSDMTNPATVSDFRLDTYEVTIARFRQFVDAGMGTSTSPPPIGAGARALNGMTNQAGWDAAWNAFLPTDRAALVLVLGPCNWTDAPGANDALPMGCISWFMAFAFCAWDGGFLPTEAEWNYAAAGGNEHRAYPWSNPASSLLIDCSYANYYAPCVSPPNGAPNHVGSESPKGDGKWGHADLGGNLIEWTLDWHTPSYMNPCNDCAALAPTMFERVFRGGNYGTPPAQVRGAVRLLEDPFSYGLAVGVRCARAP